MPNLPDLDLQIFDIISKIIDLDVQILDLDVKSLIWDSTSMTWTSKSMIFEIISKIWGSKSLISTQLQDCPQIMVFEMVYLLLRAVFEINRITRGTQIATLRSFARPWLPRLSLARSLPLAHPKSAEKGNGGKV